MNSESINRIPPQSIDAEKAVLGSIFLNTDSLQESLQYLRADDFYTHSHQIIFKAMEELDNDEQPIDLITITNYLKDKKKIDDVGGVQYLTDLAQYTPTAANAVYYAKIVRDKSISRKLISAATNIVTAGYDGSENVDELLANAESDILRVGENLNRSGFKQIEDVVTKSIKEIEKLRDKPESVTGLSTGYNDLDNITTGLHDGELIIIAARPAVGKTAFALNIARNVALESKKAVAIFSLEMGAESLVNRMLCASANVDAYHVRTGQLTQEEFNSVSFAGQALKKTQVYIDDTPGIRMAEIQAKCRRLAKENENLGLIVIDYLQLIESGNHENRQQEVSMISRQLKKLAKELEVPVIALSQLSRGVEQRQDKRPVLSDIRESGSIEQDADIVSFLYREDYYERDNDSDDDGNEQKIDDNNICPVEVIIEKNRSGARGTVNLLFQKAYNKFVSPAPAQMNG